MHNSRVREIDLSFAGHFVRRTFSPSPDILNSRWTFHCIKMSSDLLSIRRTLSLIYSRRSFCPAISNPFAGHFSKFAGHVWRVRRISRTLITEVLRPQIPNNSWKLTHPSIHKMNIVRLRKKLYMKMDDP